jgi:hypothetical protein
VLEKNQNKGLNMIKWILLLTAMATAEVYDNPSLNTHFETPAGWVMDKLDTSSIGVSLLVTRVGLKPVHIWIQNLGDGYSAHQETEAFLFWEMKLFYNRLSGTDLLPSLEYIKDTLYSSGMQSAGFVIKQIPRDRELACYSESLRNIVHKICFESTPSDFDTNFSLYSANWLNISYINLTLPTTKITVPTLSQSAEKKIFINILGQKLDPNSTQAIGSTRLFNK